MPAVERLARLHAHLSAAAAEPPTGTLAALPVAQHAAAAADENEGLKLLTDRQLKDFLIDGVAILQVDEMPREWHEAFYAKALAMSQGGRGRGSLWSEMPEITQVCRTPTVRGALTSILGRDYVMHPHRALHTTSTGDQGLCVAAAGRIPCSERLRRPSACGARPTPPVHSHLPAALACVAAHLCAATRTAITCPCATTSRAG